LSKKTITLAFIGSAKVKPLTIQSAMNDWLGLGAPDSEGYFEESEKYEIRLLFPAGPQHWNDALEDVWKWSAQAALPYDLILDKNGKSDDLEYVVEDADEVHEVTNVSKALVDTLADVKSDEKYVIALWGDEGDDEADAVMTFAEAADIRAKDLSAGLDDLQFGDEEEEEPEPEPEPEPERPSRRRRGAKPEEEAPAEEEKPRRRRGAKPEPVEQEQSLDEDEEALDDEPVQPEPVKEEKPKATRKAKDKPAPEPEPVKDEPVAEEKSWGEAGAGHVAKAEIPSVVFEALQQARKYLTLIEQASAALKQVDDTPSPLRALLGEALSALENLQNGEPTTVEPVSVEAKAEEPKRRGRPRTKEEVFPYLHNEEEGTYRKAGRGRPRRGETRVELTQAQVDDLTAQELIED
jgi:hypothetical protein